jgi:hypothetical protein
LVPEDRGVVVPPHRHAVKAARGEFFEGLETNIAGFHKIFETVQPRSFAELRTLCRIRTATLYQHLAAMIATGRITKSVDGYQLIPS